MSGFTLNPPKISNKRLFVKRFSSVSLITLIVFSGAMSVVQTVEFWTLFSQSHPEAIDPAEVAALDYFREHWPTSSVNAIIAPTRTSWSVVHAFSSVPITLQHYHLIDAMFRSKNMEMTVFLLNLLTPQPRYLYLAARDYASFNDTYSHGCFVRYILPNLHLLYNSSGVEIYELPLFTAPSPWFETPLVIIGDLRVNDSSLLHHPDVVSMFSLRGLDYSVLDVTDPAIQEGDILVMDEDPVNGTTPQIVSLVGQIINGSSLVVLNTRGLGFFADLLNLTKSGNTSVDGIASEGTLWQVPLNSDTISCPIYTTSTSLVQIISNWTTGGVAVSGLSFFYPFGDGSITYVNVKPYLDYMNALDSNNTIQREIRATLYNSLGDLTQFIGLENPTSSLQLPSFEVKAEEVVLKGTVNLASESFFWYNYTSRIDVYGAMGEPFDLEPFPKEGFTQSGLPSQHVGMIEANHVVVTGHGISQYTAIEILGSFTIVQTSAQQTRQSSSSNAVSSTSRDSGSTIVIEQESDEMTLLLAQTPDIQVWGNATFNGMNVAEHLVSTFYPDPNYPLLTVGYISFQVQGADQSIILTDINFEGQVFGTSRAHWNEWAIPIGFVALSVPHLLILGFVALLTYISFKPSQTRPPHTPRRSSRTSK
jgi:hypothetical protein